MECTRWCRYVSIEISPSCTTSGGGAIWGGQGGAGMFHRNLTIMYYQWGWCNMECTRWCRYVSIEISPSCTTSGVGTVGGGQGGSGIFP